MCLCMTCNTALYSMECKIDQLSTDDCPAVNAEGVLVMGMVFATACHARVSIKSKSGHGWPQRGWQIQTDVHSLVRRPCIEFPHVAVSPAVTAVALIAVGFLNAHHSGHSFGSVLRL